MMRLIKVIITAALMLALLSAFGCGSANRSGSISAPVSFASTPSAAVAHRALRIVVMLDMTGSANKTRTEHNPDPRLFEILIGLLRRGDGDLRIGFIRDQNNRPLLRLSVLPPPVKPQAPKSDGANPFEYGEKQAEYEQELPLFEQKRLRWQAETDEQVSKFMSELEPLLKRPADAGRTNIASALARCDLALAEPEIDPKLVTHRYAVFVTDGLDNMTKHVTPMRSKARLIVVNGAANFGLLESLHPEPFENLKAAFEFIASQEK